MVHESAVRPTMIYIRETRTDLIKILQMMANAERTTLRKIFFMCKQWRHWRRIQSAR